MKLELHIPVEQYGYVAAELEGDPKGLDPMTIRSVYDSIQHAFKDGDGLSDSELTDFLYSQVRGKGNHIETWEQMNAAQKRFVKLLKNALARK